MTIDTDLHSHVSRSSAGQQAHQQTEDMLREAGIMKIRTWKRMAAEEYSI